MKIKSLFLLPFLLLIFGSSVVYGNGSIKNDLKNDLHYFSTNTKFQFSETNKLITLIEENNSDNDEESHSNDTPAKIKVNFFDGKKQYLNLINKNLIPLFESNFYNNQFVTLPPININANPLYLQQRVFRI